MISVAEWLGKPYLDLIRIALRPEACSFIYNHGAVVLGENIFRLESIDEDYRWIDIHVMLGR